MGVISDWQEKDDTSNYLLDHLAAFERQYAEGRNSKDEYHKSMAMMHVLRKECDKVRYHCAQISPDASKEIKAETLFSLARTCVIENKLDEALEYYEKVYETEPELEMASTEGGEILLELERYSKALVYFQRSLVVEPECNSLYTSAGKSAAGIENYELALDYFTKAIQYDEDKYYTAENEYFLGLCYDKLGDFYRSLHHYTLCLDDDPLFGEALGNMAAAYYNHDGDVENAFIYLKKAEAIAEKTKNAPLLQLIYMNLARLYDKIKDFDNHEHYKQKMMESLGFGFMYGEDEEDEEDEEDDDEEMI